MSAEPFTGEITAYGFDFSPRGWSACNGALLAISSNTALFSLLGTNYGGDGRSTMGLPDLRGRSPISYGKHPGSSFDWRVGQIAGREYYTLSTLQMPQHNHTASFTPTTSTAPTVTLSAMTELGTSDTPSNGAYLAKTNPTGSVQDGPEQIYTTTVGTAVELGGIEVTGGSVDGAVTVNNNGASQSFPLIQPIQAVNYCIALQGTYPSRS